MKFLNLALLGLMTAIVLLGARCTSNNATSTTTISQAVLTSGLKQGNAPANDMEEVAAGTPVIYLSAEVSNPTKQTTIQVTWIKLPDQVVATETFDGKRGTNLSHATDFDETYKASWLASQARRPSASWALGEYRVEVMLNNRLAKTIFFTVVSDAQAEQVVARRIVRQIQTGDTLTDDNQLANAKTSFQPTTDNIYIQLSLANERPGAKLQVSIKHLKTGTIIDTFSSVIGTDLTPLFTLSRDHFNRSWPTGAFEITVKVDGIIGRTASFSVQD